MMFINHIARGPPPGPWKGPRMWQALNLKLFVNPLTGQDSEGREGSNHSGFGAENRHQDTEEAAGPPLSYPGEK